jgi:hypothetical protein
LRDPVFFAQVKLAEWGAPVWPNGVDIAPDALHQRIGAGGDRHPSPAGNRVARQTK